MSVSTFSEIKPAAFLVHVSCTLSQYDFSLKNKGYLVLPEYPVDPAPKMKAHTESASGGNESYVFLPKI